MTCALSSTGFDMWKALVNHCHIVGGMKTLPGKVQRACVKFALSNRNSGLKVVAYFMSSNLPICKDDHISLG